MDISSEIALQKISKWERQSTPLAVIAKLDGLLIQSLAKVSAVSESELTLALEGDCRLVITLVGELKLEEEETLLPKDGSTSVFSKIIINGYCRIHELPDRTWPPPFVSELIQ